MTLDIDHLNAPWTIRLSPQREAFHRSVPSRDHLRTPSTRLEAGLGRRPSPQPPRARHRGCLNSSASATCRRTGWPGRSWQVPAWKPRS